MNRRQALQAMGALGAITITVGASGCEGEPVIAMQPWSGPPRELKDVRLRALSYAVLAPNAHNTQPWRIALPAPDIIDLYVDPARLLPHTDPHYRQTHVSQGTFLEFLALALGELGQRATVEYFPEGEYSNAVLEPRAVARVRIEPQPIPRDPLFAHITGRRSNKRSYDPERRLPPAATQALLQSVEASEAPMQLIIDATARQRLCQLATTAMAVEVADRQRNIETAKWFRFSDQEIERKRDGFGLAHNGATGVRRWVAETFLVDRERAADPEGLFAKGAVDLAKAQLESAPAFGIITTLGNTRRAQLLAGRAYARVALTAESLGVAMHPLSQMLEEYPAMQAVKTQFEQEIDLTAGSTAQMFFRLGFAEPAPHTPRRAAQDLLRA